MPDTLAQPFAIGETVHYPAHGIGTVVSLNQEVLAGNTLSLYAIEFQRAKLTVRVPVRKVQSNDLIPIARYANELSAKRALSVLGSPSQAKREHWHTRSKTAREKINSNDFLALASVIRDFNYSAEQEVPAVGTLILIREAAERLIDTLAFVWSTTPVEALTRVNRHLQEHDKRPLSVRVL